MPHAYATYFDVNYLVKGVAMIRSLLASDPGSSVRVVCLDDDTFRLLARLDIPGLIPGSPRRAGSGATRLWRRPGPTDRGSSTTGR